MRLTNNFRMIVAVLLILSWAVNIFPLGFSALHTYHTSLTRIDYKAKEKRVEISIQLFNHDLVPTLERRAKKPIDLEKTADIDKIIFKYLSEKFILSDKNDKPKEIVWVGKEVSVDTVFVYLETGSEENLEGFKLRNTLFFESFPEQTNLVIARFNGEKVDLLFEPGDGFKEIKSTRLDEKN